MNILYYCWNENTSEDILWLFQESGYDYTTITYPFTDYDHDDSFETQVDALFTSKNFDLIFTFNYFPVFSKIADTHHIPYAAWVYDCPHLTLYSHRVISSYTYFFLFDQEMCHTLSALGACHVHHLPLAVNTKRLSRQLCLGNAGKNTSAGHSCSSSFSDACTSSYGFQYPVSFLGSLYENNPYRQILYLPEGLRGYLEGLMHAQQKIWGYSILNDLLTEKLLEEIQKFVKLEQHPDYSFTARDIFLSILEKEITHRERTTLLQLASQNWETHLFTASDAAPVPACIRHGYVSYTQDMPEIFYRSKINLNITLRSIHSGIPLRCMDIMGAGGFLLSNHQPELSEYFVSGQEFVSYESEEDMLEKIQYYLSHETEREGIARAGYEKICTDFSYPAQFQKLLDQLPC